MFRQITLLVVPAALMALMLCAADNSVSQAFAKGGMSGKGEHGFHNFNNRRDFHNRYYGRYYGWGYPSYCCEYPVCAPVCQPAVPVVAETPAPVCTTCAPTCVETYPVYGYGFGYGREHRDGSPTRLRRRLREGTRPGHSPAERLRRFHERKYGEPRPAVSPKTR